jgi:hypothetical protein
VKRPFRIIKSEVRRTFVFTPNVNRRVRPVDWARQHVDLQIALVAFCTSAAVSVALHR